MYVNVYISVRKSPHEGKPPLGGFWVGYIDVLFCEDHEFAKKVGALAFPLRYLPI